MLKADLLLQQLEQRRQLTARVNRTLLGVLPLMALFLGIEAVRWASAESSSPASSLVPDLSALQKPPAVVPELRLSSELFPSRVKKQEKPAAAAAGPTQVAVKEVQWKLLGVVMMPVKRAYLENSESQQTVSVGEGERVGDLLVKRIDERSVLLEKEGSSYEIRL